MKLVATTTTGAAAFCFLLSSCSKPQEIETLEPMIEPAPERVSGERADTVELIELLGHPDEITRGRAVRELMRYLVVDTGAPEYLDRLTRFQKFAPHACREGNEEQIHHILSLFAAQGDISSILVKECLQSPHARVRAAALGVAHFSDNAIDESILVFEPDPATLESYQTALRRLGSPEAEQRLVEVEDR